MAVFKTNIKSFLDDWENRGLISAKLAATLRTDVDIQSPKRSFSSIAVTLGVVCLCFGAMTFVAANWDGMSRLARLALLVVVMALSYGVAAGANNRGSGRIAEAFILLGCGIFGATVMLVGQMYHLSGHASGAILLWAGGTLAAALFTRSVPALCLAVILATLWSCWLMSDNFRFSDLHYRYLPVWLVCAGLAFWLRSPFAARLCALGLQIWALFAVFITIADAKTFAPLFVLLTVSFAVVSILLWSRDAGKYLRGFETAAVQHVMFFAFTLIAVWYFVQYEKVEIMSPQTAFYALPALLAALTMIVLGNGENRYDHIFCVIWIAASTFVLVVAGAGYPYILEAYGLAVSVWTIRMGGRQDSNGITRLGYLGFAAAMLLIYAQAAGGLLGTSLFYIFAGVLLVAGALLVPRIFRARSKSEELPS